MIPWYRLAYALARRLDPETAHRLALSALAGGLVVAPPGLRLPGLGSRVFGLDFPNPVGLAAGFDKHAQAAGALLRLGFGFVEVGGVTPRPQPGNPRPRLFRLEQDQAIVNRMGLNSDGAEAVRQRLARRRPKGIVGVNLAANKDSPDRAGDYLAGLEALHGVAAYFTVNVSSPNTPGLRDLQDKQALDELLGRLVEARGRLTAPGAVPVPLLLKISPDLDGGQREAVAEAVTGHGLDGLVVCNTTTARPGGLKSPLANEKGGLSGPPLFDAATELLADMHRLTAGRLPLVGVGGISSGQDAYRKIRQGASLVQIYTVLIYRGPWIAARIARELWALLERDGFGSVADAVGADLR